MFPIKRRQLPLNRSSGFTFLELIFVVVILVVITALAIPQFRNAFNYLQFQGFVSDTVSFARYGQARAITDRKTDRLSFDLKNGYMMLESSVDGKTWTAEKFKPIPSFVSVTLEGDDGEIKFYPDGTADGKKVTISGPSGKGYVISTEAATGYVKVEELAE